MGRPTENSVAGGLIILAFTICGALVLGVVGLIAMKFVALGLWVPPVGPDPYAGLAKALHVATYALPGVFVGLVLGGGIGALLGLRYLWRTKDP